MKRIATAALAVGLLSASASAAVAGDISQAQVAGFRVGVTTYDEVVRALGQPANASVAADGSRSIGYVAVHSHIKAASFIPIVGLFAGGATVASSTTYFTFGPDGRLTGSTSSGTNVDCSSNILAMGCNGGEGTAPLPTTTAQPPLTAPAAAVRLGVTFSDLPPLTATMLGRTDMKAAMIVSVVPGSVAERGGIKAGDCVTSYDGRPVTGKADLLSSVQSTKVGQQVPVTIFRSGATTLVTLQF